jgi:uncharacterized protein (DUF4415 family)
MRKTPELAAELRALENRPDSQVDTSDIAEKTDWASVERGRFYRPIKQVVTIRLDADIVAWFKSAGPRYQTAVNQVLRNHVRAQSSSRGPRQAKAITIRGGR